MRKALPSEASCLTVALWALLSPYLTCSRKLPFKSGPSLSLQEPTWVKERQGVSVILIRTTKAEEIINSFFKQM